MAKAKKLGEASKVSKTNTVVLYDVNEHPVTVAAEEVERYVAMGYRKELPKK